MLVLALFSSLFGMMIHPQMIFDAMFSASQLTSFAVSLWHTIVLLFWLALAPFCWIVAYFRLKESEC